MDIEYRLPFKARVLLASYGAGLWFRRKGRILLGSAVNAVFGFLFRAVALAFALYYIQRVLPILGLIWYGSATVQDIEYAAFMLAITSPLLWAGLKPGKDF